MKDRNTCPVCGKPGIPDYLADDVVCPQCGSNLRIYRMLHESCVQNPKRKWFWTIPVALFAIASIVLGIFSYNQYNELSGSRLENEEIKQKLAIVSDSIKTLKVQLRATSVADSDTPNAQTVYVVRKGDSFWKISQRFFKRGALANRIASDNNMQLSDVLLAGDTLIINH